MFNAAKPVDDGQFADYVTNPTLPAVIEVLFSVPAPTNFPRTDLVAAFLTGIRASSPAVVWPPRCWAAEHCDHADPDHCSSTTSAFRRRSRRFPGRRRPGDDVTDRRCAW